MEMILEKHIKEIQEKNVQNRKVFMDILRVVATCAVVLLHTVTGVKDTTDMNRYPAEFRVFLAVMDLITWSVPIFIMISGYLFLNPTKSITWKQMIVKYCRRILLALFLFGVPYACMELLMAERSFDIGMLGKAVVMVLQGKSWSHMWYLYLIFFLYLITPAMRWVLQRIPDVCVYGVMAVLVIGSSIFLYINKYLDADVLPVLPDTCIYVFYYLCGYLVVRRAGEAKKETGIPKWVLPVVIAVLAVGMVSNRMLTKQQIQMAYDYPFTVAFAVLLFVWAANRKWKLSEKSAGIWARLSELCFAIYLIHPVFVNVAYKFLHVTPLDYPLYVSLPLFWIVNLVLAAICAWVLRQLPVLRKYVL